MLIGSPKARDLWIHNCYKSLFLEALSEYGTNPPITKLREFRPEPGSLLVFHLRVPSVFLSLSFPVSSFTLDLKLALEPTFFFSFIAYRNQRVRKQPRQILIVSDSKCPAYASVPNLRKSGNMKKVSLEIVGGNPIRWKPQGPRAMDKWLFNPSPYATPLTVALNNLVLSLMQSQRNCVSHSGWQSFFTAFAVIHLIPCHRLQVKPEWLPSL